MKRLLDKVAVITGGNSGVGAECAKVFAREGAKLVISARRLPQLNDIADEIRANGGEVIVMQTDISNPNDCKNLIAKTIETYGKIDILVNNAGVLEKVLLPINKVKDEDIDSILEINTKGTLYCMREASAVMNAGSSIINVASVAGVIGNGGAAYVASKGAVISVTRHTALCFASKQIRCNAICPGTIITPMTMNLGVDSLDEGLRDALVKHNDLTVPPCMPVDVANIALFLASDESKALTGQILVSDFGSTL